MVGLLLWLDFLIFVSVSVDVVLSCYSYLSEVMVVVVFMSFISGDHWLRYVFVVENVLQLHTCCNHQVCLSLFLYQSLSYYSDHHPSYYSYYQCHDDDDYCHHL
jgi:hypothetical protein